MHLDQVTTDKVADSVSLSKPGLLRMENVAAQLSPRHPIYYDSYCLCDLSRDEKLDSFNVVLLKEILRYFEVPFASRNWKKSLTVS